MLTGEAKKAYQREYMRKRRSNKGLTAGTVRPEREVSVIPKIPGLVMEGNRIVGISKNDSERVLPPIYTKDNFRQFKAGEVVRVWQGKRLVEIEIPELDAEGNPM